MIDDTWVYREELNIRREKKRKTSKIEEMEIMIKFLILIGAISLMSFNNIKGIDKSEIPKGNNGPHAGIWGSTWKCPNSSCGYDNYDDIKYCALCGTRKP